MKPTCAFALSMVAACSHARWDAPARDGGAPQTPKLVACETKTTCTLACDASSTFTTIDCESITPNACASSRDARSAYGCTFACDHESTIVATCDDVAP